MKKILKLMVSLALVVSLTGIIPAYCPQTGTMASAQAAQANPAASGRCGKNVTWELDRKGTLTISGSGAMTNFKKYGSNRPWDNEASYIRKILIEEGVTSIGNYAFYESYDLTSITLPVSMTSIGREAFAGCRKLAGVTIPKNVTTIGREAFRGCSKIAEIIIPASVKKIGTGAFNSMSKLKSIKVKKENKYFSASGGVLFDKKKKTLIRYPERKSNASYTVPKSVKEISACAFLDGRMRTLKTGDNVTVIGSEAMMQCSALRKLVIGKNVVSIGENAFYGCKNIKSVTIPSKVKKIGKQAFGNCPKLNMITIMTKKLTVSNIGKNAFKSGFPWWDMMENMGPEDVFFQGTVKVPASKLKEYKKLLWKRGVSPKAKIKAY